MDALEQAFEVKLEPREPGDERGLLAAIDFQAARSHECPSLTIVSDGDRGEGPVRFADSGVDARLRGRELLERDAPADGLRHQPGHQVLATRGRTPVWTRSDGGDHLAARAPVELEPDEPLKQRLRAGRFQALLPLVAFLREQTAARAWQPPPQRALLMFDDPNLHWPSYGHIDYRELTRHAEQHDYHAAMGMIPLDARIVHPEAARLFKAPGSRLSVLMHGINHEHRELMQPLPEGTRAALFARALARVEAFERRSRVPVSRVMCAPHGEASEEFLGTMLDFGLEAQFADLPFPWITGEPATGPSLTYWSPANFVAGGLPVIPRYPLTYDRDEVVLRAYLDHPLVLYGHHEDLEDGLDLLADAAALVNGLAPTKWCSAEEIARTNHTTRRRGTTFEVGMMSRAVRVDLPEEIETIEVRVPPVYGPAREHEIVAGTERARVDLSSERPTIVSLAVTTSGPLFLELRPRDLLADRAPKPAAVRPWPIARRVLTEGRDRLRPIFR